MTKERVASISELAPGKLQCVSVGGKDVCLARTADGAFYAIDNACTHEDFALCESDLTNMEVECAMHGSRFDLRTGAVTGQPATLPVRTHKVTVENDAVFVELSS